MAQLRVVVDKLNKRKSPVLNFADKSNVVEVMESGASFESVGQIVNALGTWHVNREGHWVWEKGLAEASVVSSRLISLSSPVSNLLNYNSLLFNNIPAALKNNKGNNVRIAIIDTGINKKHPSLQGNKILGIANVVDDNDDVNDINGHGSHVAGLIGGRSPERNGIIGIAPASELFIIKGIDDNKNTSATDLKKALQKAIDLNVDIINLSLDIPKQRFGMIENEIKTAAERNIIVVAAAGENGLLNNMETINCPAREANVIAVGSCDESFMENMAGVDKKIHCVVPNYFFWSCFNEAKIYSEERGSSMATALVTGVIALLMSSGVRGQAKILSALANFSVPPSQFSPQQVLLINPSKQEA